MKCNRTACEREAAGWWNRITLAFYCQRCAFRINDSSQQSGLGNICERQNMKLHETHVMVGDSDSPDDRPVKFVLGHVGKAEFAKAAGCTVDQVKHVWATMEDESTDQGPDFAWWGEEKDEDLDTAVTMVFL